MYTVGIVFEFYTVCPFKRGYIEFGVVCLDSAILVYILYLVHTLGDTSAFVIPAGQLLFIAIRFNKIEQDCHPRNTTDGSKQGS